MLGAWLAGASRPATSFRRSVAPYLRHQLPAAAAFTAVAYLLLVWWGPTLGFHTTSGLVINTLFAVAGFIGLTAITRREFPDAEPVDYHALAQRVKGSFSGERITAMRDKARTAVSRGGSTSAELERLASLHERGILTDEEFAAQKLKLLGD
ncbi:MAG: SHOCT domain-containing protein [Actinobacteria bacterium]|nr:SHOCT domain-containing protein [Actinomycetota bacterium]